MTRCSFFYQYLNPNGFGFAKDKNIYYICRDYPGSITHITNSSGSVVQELSYDAWGQLRNPANQTVYAPDAAPELFLGRGYTGHEHLAMFGLVNMNARLYDPALGRFLSPDPYVQSPLFSQNFNRFSYGMNNPLCYIDRNGELFWLIPVVIGVAIGAYIGGSMANHSYNPFNWDWSSGKTWKNMGLGGLIGGASAVAAVLAGPAIGVAICSALGVSTTSGVVVGAISGLTGGVIGGFINGAGFTALGGGNFQESMMGGLKGAVIGGGTGALAGGVFGGISAFKAGNNVWTGKDIAYDRNAFSFKNTPVIKVPAPELKPIPVSVGTVDVPQPNNNLSIQGGSQVPTEQPPLIRVSTGDNISFTTPEFTEHGLEQAITRGISEEQITNAINHGTVIEAIGRYGPQLRYTLDNITVIIPTTGRNAGKIITIMIH